MKLLKRFRKNHCLRESVIYFLTCCMVFFNIPLSVARAAPAGPDVQMGTIDAAGNTHVLGPESHLYTSNGTVIQWGGGFDIGAGESVQFHQYTDGVLSADSAVLNRILTGSQTVIDGMLQGNGQVFVVNPSGIMFGGGAVVNVTQLVASTLNISNADFAAEKYEFTAVGDSLSEVINNGTITATEGAALIAKKVVNNGAIMTSEGGFVAMAAGDRVLLGEPGSNIIVEMDSVADGTGMVTNDGTIDAPAGEVVLAAGDIYSAAMSVSAGTGKVEQNGEIHVDGATGNAGSITLTAADEVELGEDSLTTANADTVGDGGVILAYSPGTALFKEGAKVEAKGGSISGQGGLFEISGHEDLALAGDIDLTGSDGLNGTFVIDPLNLEIVPGDGIGGVEPDPENPDTWKPVTTGAYLGIDTLEGFLGSANVMLRTEGTEGPEVGDIIFNADRYLNSGVDQFNKVTDNSLFVFAAHDVRFMPDNGIHFEGNGHVELYAGPEGSVTSFDRGVDLTNPNIWTIKGDIIVQGGSGGIDLGLLRTGEPGGSTSGELRPGEIRLATTDGGDITTGHLRVEGKGYGSVYAFSTGDLTINGAQSIGGAVHVKTNATSDDEDALSFVCLIAEGDVTINNETGSKAILAEAQGKRESVAGIWIGAGTHTQEGGTPGTVTVNGGIQADASASTTVKSDATVRIYGATINLTDTPEALSQDGIKIQSDVTDYIDEDAVYVDDEGNPIPDPDPLLDRLGSGLRAVVEIDITKDGTCLDCENRIRVLVPFLHDDVWIQSKNLAVEISGQFVMENDVLRAQDGSEIPLFGHIVYLGSDPMSTNGGTLTLDAEGNIVYMPPDGWNEDFVLVDGQGEYEDSFTYYVQDVQGNVSEASATVTITLINQYPDAVDDSYSNSHNLVLDKDGATGVILGVGTDTDADNDPLTATLLTDGTYGAVDLDTGGSFRYTPDEDLMRANTNLEDDTFTYTISDGFGGTDTATVTIDLTNHAPDAVRDNYTDGHNLILDVDEATGVILGLGTDTDPDNQGDPYHPDTNPGGWLFQDDLDVESHTDPSYGTVDFDKETGAFTYTPDETLMRANTTLKDDTFTYKISDGFVGGTDTATVTIKLTNTPPVAQPDSYDVSHNTTLDLTLPGSPADLITGVVPELNGDYDPDNQIEGRVFSDTLTPFLPGGLSSGQTSGGGTVELNPDGTFIYTPAAGFTGTDSFTYYVTDSYDNSTLVEVTIVVGAAIPPAPLPDIIVWEVGGCPALMEWLADELGEAPDKVQSYGLSAVSESQNAVGTGTSIAYKGDIQWCLVCAQLKDSAQGLSDPNGLKTAALANVIVAEAGLLAGPPTPEQMDAIAAALAAAAEDTQYASARELVKALVRYVTILTDELGYNAEDAVALFMDNHGAPITEDESVSLYIGALLTNIQTSLESTGG